MSTRVGMGVVFAALMMSVTACSGGSTTEPQPAPAADASHTEHTAVGKVFFVEPKDGATVGTDVKLVFGSEQVTIAAVPPGEVTEVRPGTAHYHVAPDADCLPAGTIIPKAEPWVHFGSGANNADIVLNPGTHKLTVQAGDDQHRTMEGLCQTITVNVK
jgi:hypothetical protein